MKELEQEMKEKFTLNEEAKKEEEPLKTKTQPKEEISKGNTIDEKEEEPYEPDFDLDELPDLE